MKLSEYHPLDITFYVLLLTLPSMLLLICLVGLISSSGKPDFCYIEKSDDYKVYAHVSWRPDKLFWKGDSSDEAIKYQNECSKLIEK